MILSNTSNNNSNPRNVPNKVMYSPPASPAGAGSNATENGSVTSASTTPPPPAAAAPASANVPATPKKSLFDAVVLQTIREKLQTPGGACQLQSLRLETSAEPMNVIKGRYLVSTQCYSAASVAAAAAKTPASYRHLVDLTCSNLKCTDVYTEEQFLCKIINEPIHKVQQAYFHLQQEGDNFCSTLYGHRLIRGVHDIVPLSRTRTYVIIAAPQPALDGEEEQLEGADCIYEDLHTYIRNKRRVSEGEARALFHQICQTVQVCHRNGIILRDLKLKRFYFIDEARTKLQYESLEGSMILDNPADDTLSDKIGCPLYTAPELLCPKPTYRGKPADMWSLGVILYTMLVGQYPFYEKGNCSLITVIRHCHVQIPNSLSKSVRMLLLALLRKNFEERLPAEYIFHAPWLRDQRPYYMYIPVDVCFSDDDNDDETVDEDVAEVDADDVTADDVTMEPADVAASGSGTVSSSQPLDYSCNALRMDVDEDADAKDDDEVQQTSNNIGPDVP